MQNRLKLNGLQTYNNLRGYAYPAYLLNRSTALLRTI